VKAWAPPEVAFAILGETSGFVPLSFWADIGFISRVFYTEKWFVPLDLMAGTNLAGTGFASLEYQYSLVGSSANYKYWLETRIGYFF
jgi:hypothetical protein